MSVVIWPKHDAYYGKTPEEFAALQKEEAFGFRRTIVVEKVRLL